MNRAKTRLSILTATMVSAAALMTTPWSPLDAQTTTTEEELLEEQAASENAAMTEEEAAAAEEGATAEPVDDGTQGETTADAGDEATGQEEPVAGAAADDSAEAAVEEDDATAADETGESVADEEPVAEDETAASDDAAATTTTEAETGTDDAEETQPEEVASEGDGDAATEAEASAETDVEAEAGVAAEEAEEEPSQEAEGETEAEAEAQADVAVEETEEEPSQDAAEAEGGEEEAQAAEAPPEPAEDVEAAPEVSDKAEEEAAELLADDTPAEKLSDEELRARIAAYRELLEEPQLSVETSDRLRARLKTDRDVLRIRVAEAEAAEVEAAGAEAAGAEADGAETATLSAASEDESFADKAVDSVTGLFKSDDDGDDGDDGDDDDNTQTALILGGLAAAAIALPLLLLPDEEETVQIVSQPQPQRLEDLTDAELGRRMLALQQASEDDVNYTYAQRQSFGNELEASREELRRRLQRDRDEREIYYLDSEPYDVPINYVMPQQDYEPAIWAAEVDQQQIWRQLLVAPRGDLPQAQYGRQELSRNIEWIVTRPGVRDSLPGIELDTITFGFNEDFLREEQIYNLDRIARLIEQVVVAHPDEIFLIEGHTDAVGNEEYNWRLSQRRAEAVKELITRYYLVPPENLVTAGLGEAYLKIWTPQAEAENRRVTLRRITPLLAGYAYR